MKDIKSKIEKMLSTQKKPHLPYTQLEQEIMQVLDEAGYEYSFYLREYPDKECKYCGKGDVDFIVNDIGFHAQCLEQNG